MSCRVKIDVPAGVIELEGEAQFVSDFFEKIAPFMDPGQFGASPATEDNATGEQDEGRSTGVGASGANAVSKPRKRRAQKRPPPGASCRERVITLRDEGFFKDRRTPSEIVSGLAKKGWTHNNSQVGASLSQMFNRGEIQRTNEGGGFAYFWDRG